MLYPGHRLILAEIEIPVTENILYLQKQNRDENINPD